MAHYDNRWLIGLVIAFSFAVLFVCGENLTACQHLRKAETRRAKSLNSPSLRIPRCGKMGEFEPIQCTNDEKECWCVDEYGIEVPETRNSSRDTVKCREPENCQASSCRMFCPSGFMRDTKTGCSICVCRDPCDGIDCPNGQSCQQVEVKCAKEPCPPVPTCKKARTIENICPAGLPLGIEGTTRPFLCGNDPGKPNCPPLYECMVESGNDYGVCCPSAMTFHKPGVCPSPDEVNYSESTGYMCGTPCSQDLECRHMEKCCFTKGCQYNCQQPFNITTCQQARALSEVLEISEREGRGYVPDCNGPGGMFNPKQCSRNGLVCWCVDPRTGHKIKGSMGAANYVDCEGWENMIERAMRSLSGENCDINICAAVCEYGFKTDHNGCATCQCSEPCEGFKCPMGSHCEVATDALCPSGSSLCSSWPVCKPDLVYSNPCDIGAPLSDNRTGEVLYCFEEEEERQSRDFKVISFFDRDPNEGRSMTNRINCPDNYECTWLHKEEQKVCCQQPLQEKPVTVELNEERQQSMCEYLRDFSERMEGTEVGMQLAVAPPKCNDNGNYQERQCSLKKIKVTRAEHRKILEENTIRKMRALLSRTRRDVESLKLYRIDDSALNVQVAGPSMERSAKVIDIGANRHQGLGELFPFENKKTASAQKTRNENEIVEIDVEECWCVDNFGAEIPRSRGFNVTDESCINLRKSIDCLDLTCRMGCDYGFVLDPETKCPACQCRDPCDGVQCVEGTECRVVDVSCEDEYCPSVPACLPRKPGQCPFLVPPGSDNESDTCDFECRTDFHCDGSKRCCSNGCGTQCVEPELKTACQHLQTIQLHQSSEMGIPARQMYIAQCDKVSGKWNKVQCGPEGKCWCVDESGQEVSGTRISGKSPVCKTNSAVECALRKCGNCENGYKVDENGCQTCECRNFCDDISCSTGEECQLINVECLDKPCPKMPICIPKRESICPEGNPLKQGDIEVVCGPQNELEVCPTTHTCQLNPVLHRGVCCTKTRDVCFEALDKSCVARGDSQRNSTKWRFNPKVNQCTQVNAASSKCQMKNLFDSESACNSVCPVLTPCERLKLKNSLAAKRNGQPSIWFDPKCDPVTGNWSPIQCLGKQPSEMKRMSRSFSIDPSASSNSLTSPYGVCWCADKKGAPLKGTLTKDHEPICNSRQGRNQNFKADPIMEDLIRQMTMLADLNENELEEDEYIDDAGPTDSFMDESSVTEKVFISARILPEFRSTRVLTRTSTRCLSMKETANFQVSCEEDGSFSPLQCNGKQCWCVDAAGNQLVSSMTFRKGARSCSFTPIHCVLVEMQMKKKSNQKVPNLYDVLKTELLQLIGEPIENLRVQENIDGSAIVKFELHNEGKVDTAFALEETIRHENLLLGEGQYQPDITSSVFTHRSHQPEYMTPVALSAMSPVGTFQLVVFVLATSSAFLVSIFVVYIMLKRGRRRKTIGDGSRLTGGGDKYLDFSSPIFVLNKDSAEENSNRPKA